MPESSRAPASPESAPLREIPGLRKRERTWKDEVRDRVAARQRRRALERPNQDDEPVRPAQAVSVTPPRERLQNWAPPPIEPRRVELGAPPAPRLTAPEQAPQLPDLPLQYAVEDDVEQVDAEELEPLPRLSGRIAPPPPAAELLDEDDDAGWELDLTPPVRPPSGVERPAPLDARALAGAIDAGLLGGLFAVVVYFASRAAQTAPGALASAWPWLAGYLLLLGLAYAGCFTGLTGQTPGKMWAGIRVVDHDGRAPGVWHAVLRAAVAVFSLAAAGAGLIPILLDPARRALHDRLLGTRVVIR